MIYRENNAWEEELNKKLQDIWSKNVETYDHIAYVNDTRFMFVSKDKYGHDKIHVYRSDWGDIEIRCDEKLKRGEVSVLPRKLDGYVITNEEVLLVCKALMNATIMQENFQDSELIDKATDIAERYIKEVTN